MENQIIIDSNQAYDYQIKKLEINRKHLNEALSFGEFIEVQKLCIIIQARAKACQMWDHGAAIGKVEYDIE